MTTAGPSEDPHSLLGITGPAHEEIALRAYELWMARGCPMGTEVENWLEAEALIRQNALARNLSEQVLEMSRELLQVILDNSSAVIYVKDIQGRYLLINRRHETLFRISREKVVGRSVYDLFSPEIAEALQTNDYQVLAAGAPLEFEEEVEQDDGIHTYISIKFPIYDAAGVPYAVGGISTDITERKQGERRLAAQYAVTRALTESASLAEAAPGILQAICENLGWDVGTFWTLEPHADRLRCVEVWHAATVEIPEFVQLSRELVFDCGVGLPGSVWAKGEAVWVQNVVVDPNFPRWAVALREGLHGAFACPVQDGPRFLGALEFFSHEVREPDEALLAMMRSIGSQISQFIERRRVEKALYQRSRELELAREIQQSLHPQVPDALPGLDIAGRSAPANETGGDYFDFIRLPGDRLGIAIGDVSGHGLGPALLMAETRSYLRALALTHADVGRSLTLANRGLIEDLRGGHFITLLLARLDLTDWSLVYSNAGHWPGYVVGSTGQVKAILESTGPPLGLPGTEMYPNGPASRLEPGDVLFLLTDGIVETFGPDGSLFGMQRALDVVQVHRERPSAEIVEALFQTVREFAAGAQTDDRTVVVAKRSPPP